MGIFRQRKPKEVIPEEAVEQKIPEPNTAEVFVFSKKSIPKSIRDRGLVYAGDGKAVLVREWNYTTGDFVKKGDELNRICIRGHMQDSDSLSLKAKCDGVLQIHKEKNKGYYKFNPTVLAEDEKIFTIYTNPTQDKIKELKKLSFYNIPKIEKDDFSGSKEITWKVVGGRDRDKNILLKLCDSVILWGEGGRLAFTLNNLENKDFILFRFSSKEYQIVPGSKISFLFEGGGFIEFIIAIKPYKHSNEEDWGQIYETRLQLTVEELKALTNSSLLKWQIETPGTEIKNRGELTKDQQLIVREFAIDYKNLVEKEITDYQPLIEREVVIDEKKQDDEACYVYLMMDTVNDFHKIGISNHPDYREKTLQSEKPTIEMICNKRFPNRKIAASFEQALHSAYSEKRIRGEWFNLDKKDINDITVSLT